MNKYILSGFAAALVLAGCTTESTGYTHGSRTYDDGYYGQGQYRDSGDYDRGGYDGQYHRQAEAQSDTVVVHEHNTTVNQAQVSHAQVSHGTSATVSHGHNANKAAVGSSTKPAKVPSAGKHPPSDKTSKSEKKTEKKTE